MDYEEKQPQADDAQLQSLIEATVENTEARLAEVEANRKVAAMLQSLYDAFTLSCEENNDTVQALRAMREKLAEIVTGQRAILLYIAADSAEEKRAAERYREQINGLVFGKQEKGAQAMYPSQIRRELTEKVNEEELRTLCFDWGIDYDSLPGKGKAAKVRELVAREQRHDGVGRLRQWLETQKAPGG